MAASGSYSRTVLAVALVCMALFGQSYAQLKVGYYNGKCNQTNVENEIYSAVSAAFAADRTVPAALLRLMFHDAYGGCDGSLLLDGPEKKGVNNLSVRGYNVIDACKARLEQKCPGVVSCTDILVVATRVAVSLAGGSGTWYNVETGRRDSLTSNGQDAVNLPSPTTSVKDTAAKFAQRGLSTQDMVVLIAGGHTIGIIHCDKFKDRLYNYMGTGLPDPSMNATTLASLRNTCPNAVSTKFAFADQTLGSSMKFDRKFCEAITQGKGLLQIDQRLASDPLTKSIVTNCATTSNFVSLFSTAINTLARYRTLTGTNGQIRKICSRVNT